MMPELMNCQHSPSGWCLACVGELHSQWDAMRTVTDAAAGTADKEAAALVAFRQAVADALDALRADVKASLDAGQIDFISSPVDIVRRSFIAKLDATIAALGLAAKEKSDVSA